MEYVLFGSLGQSSNIKKEKAAERWHGVAVRQQNPVDVVDETVGSHDITFGHLGPANSHLVMAPAYLVRERG